MQKWDAPQTEGLGHQLYAVAFKYEYKHKSRLEIHFKANNKRQINLTDDDNIKNDKKDQNNDTINSKNKQLSSDNETCQPRNSLRGEIKAQTGLQFRIPTQLDLDGVDKAEKYLQENSEQFNLNQ